MSWTRAWPHATTACSGAATSKTTHGKIFLPHFKRSINIDDLALQRRGTPEKITAGTYSL
jgi:hypothetical protein